MNIADRWPRWPIVLNDAYLLTNGEFQPRAHPRAQPTPKGSGAFRTFETTQDVSKIYDGE